jgi:hypothetical protein
MFESKSRGTTCGFPIPLKKMKVQEGLQNFEVQTKVENKGTSLVAQLTYKEIYSNCSMVNNPICHDLN